jgi:hypothetical protein
MVHGSAFPVVPMSLTPSTHRLVVAPNEPAVNVVNFVSTIDALCTPSLEDQHSGDNNRLSGKDVRTQWPQWPEEGSFFDIDGKETTTLGLFGRYACRRVQSLSHNPSDSALALSLSMFRCSSDGDSVLHCRFFNCHLLPTCSPPSTASIPHPRHLYLLYCLLAFRRACARAVASRQKNVPGGAA